MISFGVAPAALAYARRHAGRLGRAVLTYFVCCGVSRLARYNVTAESLVGRRATRSSTSRARRSRPAWCWRRCSPLLGLAGRLGADLLGGALDAAAHGTLHPLVLLFALSGTLMISKTLRIPKL